jgi:Xaa-Pro aminopeptidase
LIPREGRPTLFIDDAKLDTGTRDVLDALADRVAPADLLPTLDRLINPGQRVRLDRATAAAALHQRIRSNGATVDDGPDPIALMKAVKNAVERAGIREAHRRDGAALVRFLAWFDQAAPAGGLTEIDVVEKLEAFRAETGALMDVAFPTIAGSGPNGAIVHYRVTRATNRHIGTGELFLLDSGAQYRDGTTDVTRTLAVGTPTDEMRARYTDVLRGHLAVSRAVFPKGTTGAQLDPFARQFLWQQGLDYEHGTGHGVGAYLSVHEGPQRISKLGHVALERGMLLSNEPGFYKTGAFGIRIENLVFVDAAAPIPGAEKEMNAFETVTLVPYDRRLIDVARLDAAERAFIDAYHARVRAELAPLAGEAAGWLEAATAPL